MEYEFHVSINTKSKKAAKLFCECFKEELSGEMDEWKWEALENEMKDFKRNAGCLDFYPFFRYCMVEPYYTSLEKCFKYVAKNAIDDEFDAEFIVHNCSSDYDNVHASFSYSGKKLSVSYVNTSSSSLYCDDCDEDMENEIATIEEHAMGAVYKCPRCGKELTFDETGDSREYVIAIVNDELVDVPGEVKIADWKKQFAFTVEGTDITIGKIWSRKKEIIVPEHIGNGTVVKIGEEFCYNKENIKIRIPNTVKVIERAFLSLKNVEIWFPESITEIGEAIILGGSNVIVHIPPTVTFIHKEAFCYLCSLTIVGEKGSYAEKFVETFESNASMRGDISFVPES
ncbi:MAG: leucine-rich repeat domain-containing protein [Dorea sp.]|nr:leucine-rich repeat domain-containing protein [Dorea sp.]